MDGLAVAEEVVTAGTALAGLILIYIGTLVNSFASFTAQEQKSVKGKLATRAWLAGNYHLEKASSGTYQHVSQQHLKRYLGEFDFRYNTRDIDDMERTVLAAKGIVGKRFTYRRTDSTENA